MRAAKALRTNRHHDLPLPTSLYEVPEILLGEPSPRPLHAAAYGDVGNLAVVSQVMQLADGDGEPVGGLLWGQQRERLAHQQFSFSLFTALGPRLGQRPPMNVHSVIASGSPQVDVSTPFEGVVV